MLDVDVCKVKGFVAFKIFAGIFTVGIIPFRIVGHRLLAGVVLEHFAGLHVIFVDDVLEILARLHTANAIGPYRDFLQIQLLAIFRAEDCLDLRFSVGSLNQVVGNGADGLVAVFAPGGGVAREYESEKCNDKYQSASHGIPLKHDCIWSNVAFDNALALKSHCFVFCSNRDFTSSSMLTWLFHQLNPSEITGS